MKNYRDIANTIFERRDRYVAAQKKKRQRLMRVSVSVGSVALVALMGFELVNGSWFRHEPAVTDRVVYPSSTVPGGEVTTDSAETRPTNSTMAPTRPDDISHGGTQESTTLPTQTTATIPSTQAIASTTGSTNDTEEPTTQSNTQGVVSTQTTQSTATKSTASGTQTTVTKTTASQTKPTVTKTTISKTKPTATQSKPTATQSKPTATQSKPTATQSKPTATQSKPTATQSQPTTPTQTIPTVTQTKPTASQTRPTATQTQPTQSTPTTQPTIPSQGNDFMFKYPLDAGEPMPIGAMSAKVPSEYSGTDECVPVFLGFGLWGTYGWEPEEVSLAEKFVLRIVTDTKEEVIIREIDPVDMATPEYYAKLLEDENGNYIGMSYNHTETIHIPLSLCSKDSGVIWIEVTEYWRDGMVGGNCSSQVSLLYTRTEIGINFSVESIWG